MNTIVSDRANGVPMWVGGVVIVNNLLAQDR